MNSGHAADMANRKSSLDKASSKVPPVGRTRSDSDAAEASCISAALSEVPSVVKTGRLWGGNKTAFPETLGKRLAAVRTERKMTQGDLAVRLNRSRTTVNQYEMNNISPPLTMINEIARALEVDPIFIAFGQQSSESVSHDRIWVMEGTGRSDDFIDMSPGFQDKLRIRSEETCLMMLQVDAPSFDLKRGDHLIIDLRHTIIGGDGRLYAVRSSGGCLNLVRSDIQLEGPVERVRITFGQGQVSEVVADKVDVIGVVRGTLRLE